MVSVPIRWNSIGVIDPAEADDQNIQVHGFYDGSDYSVADNLCATVNVTVLGLEKTANPAALPSAGKYTGLQRILLEADDGATVWFALAEQDAQGNKPDAATLSYSEYTDPVVLNEYGKTIFLYAYAGKEGMRNSNTVSFRYELTKPEVTKLDSVDPMIAEDGNIECWYSTRNGRVGNDDNGNAVYEDVPDRYYADEDCTTLLDYEDDVLLSAFIRTSHESSSDDAAALCIAEDGNIAYDGLEMLGVQAIRTDGEAARVLTVLDSRIIGSASDYGYLFTADATDLTWESAQHRFSCKETENTLYSGDYCYVTARIPGGLDPAMRARFYVKLENDVDYVYTDTVLCGATIGNSAATDAAADNITPAFEHVHNYATLVNSVAPTCVSAGYDEYKCACGDINRVETGSVDPANHVNTTEAAETDSTCNAHGFTAGVYCSDCGKWVSGHARKPLAPHSYADPTWEWTGTTSAQAVFACPICGDTQRVAATVTSETVKEPTATEEGKIVYTARAEFDGEIYTDTLEDTIPAAGKGLCKWCGKPHNGFWGKIVGFFHAILYFFAHLFGAR